MMTLERRHDLITVLKPHFLPKRLRYTKSFSHVLLTSRVGYHDGKPIESVVYCLNNREVYNYLAVLKELRELILVIYPYSPIHLLCIDVSSNVSYLCEIV